MGNHRVWSGRKPCQCAPCPLRRDAARNQDIERSRLLLWIADGMAILRKAPNTPRTLVSVVGDAVARVPVLRCRLRAARPQAPLARPAPGARVVRPGHRLRRPGPRHGMRRGGLGAPDARRARRGEQCVGRGGRRIGVRDGVRRPDVQRGSVRGQPLAQDGGREHEREHGRTGPSVPARAARTGCAQPHSHRCDPPPGTVPPGRTRHTRRTELSVTQSKKYGTSPPSHRATEPPSHRATECSAPATAHTPRRALCSVSSTA